jgi:hypothetical protein
MDDTSTPDAARNHAPQPHNHDNHRRARLTDWRPVTSNEWLLGFATVRFPSGMIVSHIPVFRTRSGGRSVGVPSIPVLDANGAHARDADGKKKYLPVISFTERGARGRWNRDIDAALAEADITGGAPWAR